MPETPAELPETPSELLDAEDVAALLGQGRNTVLLIPPEQLPRVVLGHRTIRYRPEDVTAYIRDHIDYGRVAAEVERAAGVEQVAT